MRKCLQTIFCLLIELFHLGVNHGAIINSPLNTAALVGEMTTLNCSTDNSVGISWTFNGAHIVFNISNPTSAGSCGVMGGYEHLYSVSVSEPGMCNLNILYTSLSDGGTYSCHESTSIYNAAELVVLESNPRCSTNATNDVVVESNPVLMGCSVTFNGSINLQPSLNWVDSSPSVNTTYPNSTFAYALWIPPIPEYSDLPSHICILDFSPPTNSPPPGAATNTPALTSLCTTNIVAHLWCPKALRITATIAGTTAVGNYNLTCIASANPNATTYMWIDGNDNIIALDQSIQIWYSGMYTCSATNIINGSPCSRVISEYITVANISTTIPAETTSDFESKLTGTNALATGLGIGFGISLFINVILAATFIIRHLQRKKKANKPQVSSFSANIPDGSAEITYKYDSISMPVGYENAKRDSSIETTDINGDTYETVSTFQDAVA